jgi:hypothetical protein
MNDTGSGFWRKSIKLSVSIGKGLTRVSLSGHEDLTVLYLNYPNSSEVAKKGASAPPKTKNPH